MRSLGTFSETRNCNSNRVLDGSGCTAIGRCGIDAGTRTFRRLHNIGVRGDLLRSVSCSRRLDWRNSVYLASPDRSGQMVVRGYRRILWRRCRGCDPETTDSRIRP
jgi:hypothetical protein